MSTPEMTNSALILSYLLLLPPLAIILWYGVPLFTGALIAVVRMTVQLLFVGLYLQVVFVIDDPMLTIAWMTVMIVVADGSIIRRAGLRLRLFWLPLSLALLLGVLPTTLFFIWMIGDANHLLDARLAIPIAGMILGNCLQANIIGMKAFYQTIHDRRNLHLQRLAAGASFHESIRPFIRSSIEASLAPTVASIATIGLVSLPGMMTGVILGGADPMTAIKYQIAIMLAIFSGTAMTVWVGISMTTRSAFDEGGLLRQHVLVGAARKG